MINLIQKIFWTTLLISGIYSQCGDCRQNLINTVCGKNGVTYKNQCYLECNDAVFAHEGACQTSNGPCGCPLDDAPVCDLDQVIYPNECIANCKGKVAIPSKLCDFGRLQLSQQQDQEIPLVVRTEIDGNTQNVRENRKNYNYRDVDYDDVDPANLLYGVDAHDYYDARHGDEFVGIVKKFRRNAGEAS